MSSGVPDGEWLALDTCVFRPICKPVGILMDQAVCLSVYHIVLVGIMQNQNYR
jgi:hypothetical protein